MNNLVRICFKTARIQRQLINNMMVVESIGRGDIHSKHINHKELERVCKEVDMQPRELFRHFNKDKHTAAVLAGRISKTSTRQGVLDERLQLESFKNVAFDAGVTVKRLGTHGERPMYDGTIRRGPVKDGLKSFDYKLTGLMNGWCMAKVVHGRGGHQDNVYTEIEELCRWVEEHGHRYPLTFFIAVIDGDCDRVLELKKRYTKILIGNHMDIQKFFYSLVV